MYRATFAVVIVAVAVCNIGRAAENGQSKSVSIVDVLRDAELLGFRFSGAGFCRIWIISDDLVQRSRVYYENRVVNELKLKLLREKARSPQVRANPKHRELMKQEIEELLRPTGSYSVGRLTSTGTDFIGITELGQTTEYLIPIAKVSRLQRYVEDNGKADNDFMKVISFDGLAGLGIQTTLHEETQFHYEETPLRDVLEDIQARHSIPILLDTRAFKKAGLRTDLPVTSFIDGVRLHQALGVVLTPLNLTCRFRYETLWVTTRDSKLVQEERIRFDRNTEIGQQLARQATVEYLESPLRDALSDLTTRYNMRFVNHVNTDEPVTMSMYKVALSSVLGALLHQLDLYCEAHDGSLVIRRAPGDGGT